MKIKESGPVHQSEDYIKLELDVPNETRNFTVGSWLCNHSKKQFNRHIGSKDNIIQDLITINHDQYKDEIITREHQLIHDILIYLILNNQGLIQRYSPWKFLQNS